ncbi:MAG TPA: transcriptional regulator, partial [Chloroflexota bacterium]
ALLWPSLQTIAAPVSSASRVERAVIEDVILKLCTGRFLTLKELAALLNRSADKLRIRYLTDLVRSHALELRYPNAPNHPAQAYRTRDNA